MARGYKIQREPHKESYIVRQYIKEAKKKKTNQ